MNSAKLLRWPSATTSDTQRVGFHFTADNPSILPLVLAAYTGTFRSKLIIKYKWQPGKSHILPTEPAKMIPAEVAKKLSQTSYYSYLKLVASKAFTVQNIGVWFNSMKKKRPRVSVSVSVSAFQRWSGSNHIQFWLVRKMVIAPFALMVIN